MKNFDPAPDLSAAMASAGQPYELSGVLGSGGMGVVYRARDQRDGRLLAIKTLHSLDSSALVRLKSEFRRAADVLHPNLVELYELVNVGDHWLLVMECIQGQSLRDMWVVAKRAPDQVTMTLDEGGTMNPAARDDGSFDVFSLEDMQRVLKDPVPTTVPARGDGRVSLNAKLSISGLRSIFSQLARGLHALHEHGLLHRDVKPANVMVDADGRVVLLDFGLIQHRQRKGAMRAHELVGTPAYMAPEQVLMKQVGPPVDWFAFGTMLFEALSGRFPFNGGSAKLLASKRVGDPQLLDYGPGAPNQLVDLTNRLCSRDPADRPGFDEVIALLDPGEARLPTLPASSHRSASGDTHLVGRRVELAEMQVAWARSREQGTMCVFVHGVSGMGKTALVDHFLSGLTEAQDAVVLRSRCYQQERVPYKALDGVIDALAEDLRQRPSGVLLEWTPPHLSDLVRVFPALRQVAALDVAPTEIPSHGVLAQEIRHRAAESLRALLARVGQFLPLVLLIDDAQWGDADSARLLDHLLAPPHAPQLLLVISYRSDEVERSEFLGAVRGSAGIDVATAEISVGPLGPANSLSLAASILDLPTDDERVARVAAEAQGIPFFVEALAKDASSQGEFTGLAEVLSGRVARLPDEQRRLLQAVALAGRPVPVELAVQATGDAGADPRSTMRRLEVARLIRMSGDGERAAVEAYHDKIREAADGSLAPVALRELHQRLATAWERRGDADPATLYRHFLGAEDRPNAGRYAVLAAEQAAQTLAFDAAADLYDRALSFLPDRLDLLEPRADALVNAGRLAEAAPLYLECSEQVSDPGRVNELRRRAAEVYLQSGRYSYGVELLKPLLKRVGIGYPRTPQRALMGVIGRSISLGMRGSRFKPRAEAEIDQALLEKIDLCWAAGKGLGSVDVMRGGLYILRSTQLALRAGDPARVSRGLGYVGLLMSSRGSARDVRDGTRFLEQAKQIGVDTNDALLTGFADINYGTALMTLGQWVESRTRLEQGIALLEESCTGVAWECGFGRSVLMCVLRNLGDQVGLLTRGSRWLQDCEQAGDLYGAVWMHVYLAEARMALGQPDEGLEEIERALNGIEADILTPQHLVGIVSASQIERYKGRPDAALERIEASWKRAKTDFAMGWQTSQVVCHLTRGTSHAQAAAERVGDVSAHLNAARADAKVLAKIARPYAQGAAALLSACVAGVHGDEKAALSAYKLAESAYDGADMVLYRAVAQHRRGGLLAGDEGDELQALASAVLDQQGVVEHGRFLQTHAPVVSPD